jgi:hypothetical protein
LKEREEVSEVVRGHRQDKSGKSSVKDITDLKKNKSGI